MVNPCSNWLTTRLTIGCKSLCFIRAINGFSKTGDYYILQSDIDVENFNVIVKIGKDSFEVNVIELPFNE